MSANSFTDVIDFEEQYKLLDDEEPSKEVHEKRENFHMTRTLPVENIDDQSELGSPTTTPRQDHNIIKSLSTLHSLSNETADVGPMAGPAQRMSHRLLEKKKKKVHFGEVHVYYFGRQQAYSVVPSKEGASLGMEDEHHDVKKYTFDGFTRARCRDNERKWNKIKKYIQDQRDKHLLSDVRRSPRRTVTFTANLIQTKPPSIKYDVSNVDAVIQDIVKNMVDAVVDDVEHGNESSSDEEEMLPPTRPLYLVPLEKHIRHALLSAANVQPDLNDYKDCKDIRNSRSKCGCSCIDGICASMTCECSLNGIKCQVDQDGFPCPCDELNCANKEGRVEFSPFRKFETTSTLPRHIKFPDSDEDSGTSTSYLTALPPSIYKIQKPDFVTSLSLNAVDVNPNSVNETVHVPIVGDEESYRAEMEKIKYPVTPIYKRGRDTSMSIFETPTKKVCNVTLVPPNAESNEEIVYPTIESFFKTPSPEPEICTLRKRSETPTPTSTSIVENVLQKMPQKRSVALNFSPTVDEGNE